jgi:hypothetical protein
VDAGAAGLDTADFHGVERARAGDAGALFSTTVDCVELGLGATAPVATASPPLPSNRPDRLSGGGSGSAWRISFADAGRLVRS